MRLIPALLLAIALLAAPAAAHAQSPTIDLQVQAGYDRDGQYRVGHWFPVTVVVGNAGADVRGALEWRFPGEDGGVFRYELELPSGARKRVTIPVVSSEASGTAALELRVDGAPVAREVLRLDPITSSQMAVGVLSTEQNLLAGLRALTLADGRSVAVVPLDPDRLPESAALLTGLDAIFVHDVATADLATAQREVLALWARLGGELIVGGGPNAERTAPGLDALLPVEVGALRGDVPAASITDGDPDAPATLTANAVTLREGARAVDDAQLLATRDVGAGRVTFAAFDLAALRTWAGEAELWSQFLTAEGDAQIARSFRTRNENLLRESLQLGALRLPSTGLLLALMALYIVVVGPLNFWALRRARRVELAWVTTPALVVLFLAAAYGASIALRGTQPLVSQLSIVQAFEGAERGQGTAFLGVFSPQRRSYSVGFEPGALVTPGTFEGFSFRGAPVTSDGATARVDELLIDVSSLRSLLVEYEVPRAPQVRSSLREEQGRITGELTLADGPELRDAVLVVGSDAQQLGALRPGEAVAVELRLRQDNFPEQLTFDESGRFNHNRVLYSLFGFDRFDTAGGQLQIQRGLPEPDGVYLLGWAEGSPLDTQIDGGASRQEGETLFIIRLGTQL